MSFGRRIKALKIQNILLLSANWITQLLVAQLIISGFVNFYTQVWNRGFGDVHQSHKKRVIYRGLLIVVSTGLSMLLFLAGYVNASNTTTMMYHNIALFILILAILDEGINGGEFLIRCVSLTTLWLLHHSSDYTTPRFGISLLAMWFVLVIIWQYRAKIEASFPLRLLVCMLVAIDFWVTLPLHSVGMLVTPSIAIQAILMFFLMKISTGNQQTLWNHNAQLAYSANYDKMTNTKNYGAYRKDIFNDFGIAHTKHQPLSMAVLDIDHFKLINDKYGHLAGNKVLTEIASVLKDTIAQYSSAYRLYRTGGEEFVLVFPDCSVNEALPVLNHCWTAVRNMNLNYEKHQIKVTISIGATEVIDSDKSAVNVYERADNSLYTSKKHGRDAVTVNGKTSNGDDNLERETYAFFVKGVYDRSSDQERRRVANELLLRSYDYDKQKWTVPTEDYLDIDTRLTLMQDALVNSRCRSIIISLSIADFLDPMTANKIIAFFNSPDGPDNMFIELKDIPTTNLLKSMMEQLHQNGIIVLISKINDNRHFEKIVASLKYVDGIKLDIHVKDKTKFPIYLRKDIQFWRDIAKKWHVMLVIDGVANQSMESWLMEQEGLDYLEGDYFGDAKLPLLKK